MHGVTYKVYYIQKRFKFSNLLEWTEIKHDKAKGEKTFDFARPVFQAFYERTGGRILGNGSEEIREYYDSEKNIAIAKQTVAGVKTTSFLYGNTNELLLVKRKNILYLDLEL